MPTIHQMADKFRSLNFDQVVRDSIEQTKETIVSLNQQNLRRGFKVDGSRIGQYVSIPYAKKKYLQSPLAGGGQVDLFLTGDWSYNITVNVGLKSFTTFSIDSKEAILNERYGNEIEGLPNIYKKQYIDILFPVIFGKLKGETLNG